jgi:hypothetical protein
MLGLPVQWALGPFMITADRLAKGYLEWGMDVGKETCSALGACEQEMICSRLLESGNENINAFKYLVRGVK